MPLPALSVGRLTDIRRWPRRAVGRYAAPPKDNVFAASDDMLAQRLRDMRLPEPSPAFRDRSRETYSRWAQARAGRQRWRG